MLNAAAVVLTETQSRYLRKGKHSGAITTLEIKGNVAQALRRRGLIELAYSESLFTHYWRVTPAGRAVIDSAKERE